MKVSIITVCYNAVHTIEETLLSVQGQTYRDVEHIVIDGASTDSTLDVLKKHQSQIDILISENDKGIYDAMNKGVQLASGDVIGFLNADDMFANQNVIKTMVDAFTAVQSDIVYGDLIYFKRTENQDKRVRYFKCSPFKPGLFAKGWCPPHPTFYAKKAVYEHLGGFDLNLKMGNDIELMMRFLEKNKISSHYIPQILVNMRVGGISNQSLKNIWLQNKMILSAAKQLEIPIATLPFIIYKIIDRTSQYFRKPPSKYSSEEGML